jgi:hypothetical protein
VIWADSVGSRGARVPLGAEFGDEGGFVCLDGVVDVVVHIGIHVVVELWRLRIRIVIDVGIASRRRSGKE